MKTQNSPARYLLLSCVLCSSTACDQADSSETPSTNLEGVPAAFVDFNTDNITVTLDGDEIVIETNGLPDHTSPYWSEGHALHVEATVATGLAPGSIDDFSGTFTLRVPVSPEKASQSSATGLGPVGIAVSGSVIYNDSEGPNVPLDNAASSLDYTGAHTGPQSYHYHLETTAWSQDASNLIGIIADGFLLYGRRCAVDDSYPTDLDASGGHTSATLHSDAATYHYHIQNELYLNTYYVLFPGDYQGTPSDIALN